MTGALWALLGPTATGKTEAALWLAERFGAEIVSLDSRQVYIGLDIGTAKPSRAQQARVPHHMIDVIPPDVQWDAMRYARMARAVIDDIVARGRRPLVVGGSGFYFAALAGALDEDLPPRDDTLRATLVAEAETVGTAGLWERLRACDPATAARLHPHDSPRIVRALEVFMLTGTPLSACRRRIRDPYATWRVVVLSAPRELHKRAIRARARRMIDEGWPDEVRRLLAEGYSPYCPGLRTLGYPEMIATVTSRMSLDEAAELIAVRTWQYAKRQLTWFRRFPSDRWVTAEQVDGVLGTIARKLAEREE